MHRLGWLLKRLRAEGVRPVGSKRLFQKGSYFVDFHPSSAMQLIDVGLVLKLNRPFDHKREEKFHNGISESLGIDSENLVSSSFGKADRGVLHEIHYLLPTDSNHVRDYRLMHYLDGLEHLRSIDSGDSEKTSEQEHKLVRRIHDFLLESPPAPEWF